MSLQMQLSEIEAVFPIVDTPNKLIRVIKFNTMRARNVLYHAQVSPSTELTREVEDSLTRPHTAAGLPPTLNRRSPAEQATS